MSQIHYKLGEYTKAISLYLNILVENKEEIESDDVSDIIVNYLACQSSLPNAQIKEVQETLTKFKDFEMSYEYHFNLSQVYLKDDSNLEAYECMRQAYEKALKDDQFKDD